MKLVERSELLVFYTKQLSCMLSDVVRYYEFIDPMHWEAGLLLLC